MSHYYAAPWRKRGAICLTLGLALLLSACEPTGGGAAPTPTVAPSPSATPTPCTTWRIVPSPSATKWTDNGLASISALSSTAAWAVGTNSGEGTIGPAESIIERWDGASWQLMANPGPGFRPLGWNGGFLNGVAALSPTDVWAVGEYWDSTGEPPGRGYKTLTMHWNGAQWSIVPSPSYSGAIMPGNALNSMVALAANDVWAVGLHSVPNSNAASAPLVERWNGAAWQVVTTPALPGITEGTFSAVARIPGSQQLWTVGYTLKGPRPAYEQPLIERWDGSAWQVVAGPALPSGSFGGKLTGVIALSATDAWAVGEYYGADHIIRILNAHWDGSAWQFVSSPDIHGSLGSVAANGPTDVRAVGRTYTSEGEGPPLIERWNGSAWGMQTVPAPSGGQQVSLSDITSDGAGAFWAVGSYRDTALTSKTLTLHCP